MRYDADDRAAGARSGVLAAVGEPGVGIQPAGSSPSDPFAVAGLVVDASTLPDRTDGDLLGHCRALLIRVQRVRPQQQAAGIREIDALLVEARRRGSPELHGRLLRSAVAARLMSTRADAGADPLLRELVAHAREHRMTVLLADAHAWRARRSVRAGAEEAALGDAATALALLADPGGHDADSATHAGTLSDLGLVLTQLGAHELADEVFARAAPHLPAAGIGQQLVSGLNQVRLLLSWALRLERAGLADQAVDRLGTARAVAASVEPLWHPAVGEAVEDCPVLGAAPALARPDPSYLSQLNTLHRIANFRCDRILVAIALGRCLERDGRPDEAVQVVAALRRDFLGSDDRTEMMLQLALAREQARLQEVLVPPTAPVAPVRDYADALEAELWALRTVRIATIRARTEQLRLAREHGAATAAALSDPLTGLPNRRALDDMLRAALEARSPAPCSIALVDLDGFKDVNDRYSHAVGDEVLRSIASALRGALRTGDTVARYGGDEFVVVLPGTPLPTARTALERAVSEVAALPPAVGVGVTLSVGVVAIEEDDRARGAAAVLARADAAMYRAKRRGGNQVDGPPDAGPPPGGTRAPQPGR